jgi:hypothetical protein
MPPTHLVEAVPGRLCPVPGFRGRFFGMAKAPAGTPDSDIVHRVPEGLAYVSVGPVSVPSTPYVRRALLRGDLREATPPASKKSAAPAREER